MSALAVCLLAITATAFAGQASSGELLFYPCSSCHPVTEGSGKKLPNDFKGHEIVLEGHDKLGVGDAACLACHDDPAKDPAKLKLANGSLIDIKGDVAQVCYRCHSAKYKEFVAGTHGKHKESCVAAGCHDPHTPQMIYAGPLLPFVGSGFQFRALAGRMPFMPLAGPAPDPAVATPWWYTGVAVIGAIVGAALAGTLLYGRWQR